MASEIRKRVSDRAGCYGLRRGRGSLEAFVLIWMIWIAGDSINVADRDSNVYIVVE